MPLLCRARTGRQATKGDPCLPPPVSQHPALVSRTPLVPAMEIDAAFSSMFISPDTGGRATSIGGGLGSEGPIPEVEVDASFASMSISHGPAQPEPRPVHRLINIRENDGVEYGLGDFDSALLALRPNLNPGTQVVQLTITSSCLLESTHDVSGGLRLSNQSR